MQHNVALRLFLGRAFYCCRQRVVIDRINFGKCAPAGAAARGGNARGKRRGLRTWRDAFQHACGKRFLWHDIFEQRFHKLPAQFPLNQQAILTPAPLATATATLHLQLQRQRQRQAATTGGSAEMLIDGLLQYCVILISPTRQSSKYHLYVYVLYQYRVYICMYIHIHI